MERRALAEDVSADPISCFSGCDCRKLRLKTKISAIGGPWGCYICLYSYSHVHSLGQLT